MSEVTQNIVVPFRRVRKDKLSQAEMRTARNPEAAKRLAENMSSRFAGVVAYEIVSDKETGELASVKKLAEYGEVLDLMKEEA